MFPPRPHRFALPLESLDCVFVFRLELFLLSMAPRSHRPPRFFYMSFHFFFKRQRIPGTVEASFRLFSLVRLLFIRFAPMILVPLGLHLISLFFFLFCIRCVRLGFIKS